MPHPVRLGLCAGLLAIAAPIALAQVAPVAVPDPSATALPSDTVGVNALAPEVSGATCVSTGNVYISSTVRLYNTNFDGGCKTYVASSALGDGSQKEDQLPVFRLENSTLRRVIVGWNGADGIHTHGNVTLDNVRWLDVGEDAMTIKSSGTVTVRNITALNAADKVFQANAWATLNVSNCRIDNALKVFRQLGGSTFWTAVTLNYCAVSNIREAIFRTDGPTSTARMTGGGVYQVKAMCEGYAAGKCTRSGVAGF